MNSQGILKDLRIKVASFERCHKDYATYVDELQNDRQRLDSAKTTNASNVSQLEQVVNETAAMIPVTAATTLKMATGMVDFWKQKKQALEQGLKSADEAERGKMEKDLAMHYKNLERVLSSVESSPDRNPLKDSKDVEDQLREVLKNIKDMSTH